MDLKKLIKKYLSEAKMMQVATSVGDQPWVATVWFVADDEFNLYWISSSNKRHSKELALNNKVAGAIVLPQSEHQSPLSLQYEGYAEQLTDQEEIKAAESLYEKRVISEQLDVFMSGRSHQFYRVTPTMFVLFDAKNFPNSPKQEYTTGS